MYMTACSDPGSMSFYPSADNPQKGTRQNEDDMQQTLQPHRNAKNGSGQRHMAGSRREATTFDDLFSALPPARQRVQPVEPRKLCDDDRKTDGDKQPEVANQPGKIALPQEAPFDRASVASEWKRWLEWADGEALGAR